MGNFSAGSTTPITSPAGAPRNPSILQQYRDSAGNIWIWNGQTWQRAYTAGTIPGRGNGGGLDPYSVYGVHDATWPEVAQFNNGRSLLFTGANGGRMIPLKPNSRDGLGNSGAAASVEVNVSIGDIISNATDPAAVVREVEKAIIPKITDVVRRATK